MRDSQNEAREVARAQDRAARILTLEKSIYVRVFGFAIILSGLLYPFGLAVLDEVALASALVWCTPKIRRLLPRAKPRLDRLQRFHDELFTVFIAYMGLQALRGAILLESPRKARWIVMFFLVYQASRMLSRVPISAITGGTFLKTVVSWGRYYLLFYCGCGLFAELVMGISRYELQPVSLHAGSEGFLLWGTSAYSLFAILAIVPCSLLLLRSAEKSNRSLGLQTLVLCVLSCLYYDSRAGVLVCLGFMVLGFPYIGARRWVIMAASGGILAATYLFGPWIDSDYREAFFNDLINAGGAMWSSEGAASSTRDLDRFIEIETAAVTVSGSWTTIFFGFGYRMGGFVIGNNLMDMLSVVNPGALVESRDFSNVGTEAFAGWLIDTGVIGLGLLLLLLTVCALRIFRSPLARTARGILMAAPVLIGAWLFVIDFRDSMLFYLMIMPQGFFHRIIYTGWRDRSSL